MVTLKKAFLKAGVVTEKQLQQMEVRQHQDKVQKQKHQQAVQKQKNLDQQKDEKKHTHQIRALCDACEKTSSDVEFYRHKNLSLDKYWLCLNCADNHSIHDQFRETSQSFHAKTGMFIRRYGPTLKGSGTV